MSRSFALLLLTATLSSPVGVSAQSDADVAAVVMRRAQEAYDSGDFERAAVLLEESIQLYEAPAIHYNLARTLSELSRWEEARHHFERFLDLAPDTEQRAAVQARIAELDRRIEREALIPPGLETQPRTETPEVPEGGTVRPPLNVAPLLFVAGGAIIALTSIPFGIASNNANERAAEAPTHREGAADLDSARRHATVTNALWITGGILALGGLIWALAKPRKSPSQVSFDGTLRVHF